MATPLTQIPLDQLKVTDGSVLEHEPGFLEVTDPAIRATVKHDRNSTASLQFRYLRRSDDVATAGSGAVFVQIGLELRALNPCNLVYVMWRIRPEELVVQVKRNPGQSTSAQCGNQGYTTISQMPYPEPEGGTLHELTAEVRELADRSADV